MAKFIEDNKPFTKALFAEDHKLGKQQLSVARHVAGCCSKAMVSGVVLRIYSQVFYILLEYQRQNRRYHF